MRTSLLFPEQDREPPPQPAAGAAAVEHDLGLARLLDTMAAGDSFLHDVARRVLHGPALAPEQVAYRQDVLVDCLRCPDLFRGLYAMATSAADARRRSHTWMNRDHPSSVLTFAVAVLRDLTEHLQRLHDQMLAHSQSLRSPGMRAFCDWVMRDLPSPRLDEVRHVLDQLELTGGTILTARLGPGCTGTDYSLREPVARSWWSRVRDALGPSSAYTYRLGARDEWGALTLSRIRDHGLNTVADTAAQSSDQVLQFFQRLRQETGFYVACLNLHDALRAAGVPTCRPEAVPAAEQALAFRGLVDAGLAVRSRQPLEGCDLEADGIGLLVVTGANQGGKSTFLRAVALAQIMTDAGMFVCADAFRASVSRGVLTHYRRPQDVALEHGKLDEELARMSDLVDHARPGSMVVLDESFASTDEREAGELAGDVVRSLADAGVRVLFVTHLLALARELAHERAPGRLFLQALRAPDGSRPHRLVPGLPESTSHAADLLRQVFTEEAVPGVASRRRSD